MNTISNIGLKRPIWQTVVMLALGFWLSASLVLDCVVMPSLYLSGMITQPGFPTAGYIMFWNYNRIELLVAGIILTAVLVSSNNNSKWSHVGVTLSVLLLAVALADTYLLTPQMSAMGLQLDLFGSKSEIPTSMNLLHSCYWLLEATKLAAGTTLFSWCWRQEA